MLTVSAGRIPANGGFLKTRTGTFDPELPLAVPEIGHLSVD
jgi:hypothetical protein